MDAWKIRPFGTGQLLGQLAHVAQVPQLITSRFAQLRRHSRQVEVLADQVPQGSLQQRGSDGGC